MNECLDSRGTRFCLTLIIGGAVGPHVSTVKDRQCSNEMGSQRLFALCFLFMPPLIITPNALRHLLVICGPHCVQLCVFLSSYLYGSHLALLQSHTVSSTAGTVIPSLWVLQGWVGVVPKALRCRRETGWGGVGVSEGSTNLAVPDLWVMVWWCDCVELHIQ